MTASLAPRVAAWDAPVLRSIVPVADSCRQVRLDLEALAGVAAWLAWEEFPPLAGGAPDPLGVPLDPAGLDTEIDLALLTTALNFAYTDFGTRTPYSAEHDGRLLVDADALYLRFSQAVAAGEPLLDGGYLATITAADLARIFAAPHPLPMLEERAVVLNDIGRVLADKYDGRFHVFVRSCPTVCFADGAGLLERLVSEFAHFNDVSELYGRPITIYKLVQLAVWTLHRRGLVVLDDIDRLTAFADYIVPAALRAMGVLHYSPALAATVDEGRLLPPGSDEENEIRVQTVYATALLTDALNAIRPPEVRLVVPQVDFRFWNAFHALIRPHHLTRTTRY